MTPDSDSGILWRAILPLSVTVMVAFGIMFYGFSVYLTAEAAGSAFSTTTLSLAYGGAVLVGGLLAMPVGRYADRHGVRPIIGLGAVVGFLGLAAFAAAREPWQVVGAWWLLIGPAGSMTFYEPAFVAVDQWCDARQRPRALAMLTVIGGLAGVLFIPGTERLVAVAGWRSAAVILGSGLLVIGGSTALFAIPKMKPSPVAAERAAPALQSFRGLVRDRRFRLYTLAMMLSLFATQAVFSHRVARFEEAGFGIGAVALWAAAASALSLPGRWLAPFAVSRFRASSVQAVATILLAAAVLLMVSGRASWQMVGHFTLFGLGFGALLPLRALMMAGWYSGGAYGRIMGAQWTAIALAGAVGPVIIGVLRDQTESYSIPSALLTVVYAAVALLILASDVEPAEANSIV